ncbi:hypothetical protein [Aeromicrobium yanjiei]|uniref:Uncharacterized protein n=1 Tax=Aeromicrobium yanjiei TaxID=2662028 RepID=A0A5Q2MPM8_9ACTN|nr:hypothetical protein [Aeromicrobium yanjiei]QGG42100.1 hypothetical protein GEV26_12380 [Aeromicrobium yanjiei]
MRTRCGWALSVLGVLLALLGAAVMVVLGPDSRFSTGPHLIETDDAAVVTTPRVISWADVQLDVLAEVPVRKPVFVGLANSVDVRDYVRRTKRLEVTDFKRPWDITTRSVDGRPNLPGAPTALDWWIDSSAGLGGASISTQLPDQTVSLAILSVGSSNLSGLEVTVAYGVKGGFAKGLALLLLGLGVAWIGVLVRRGDGVDDEDDPEEDVVEEIVYVYVDEDGVEHEISADEARALEVVAEVEEPAPESKPDPQPEPQVVYVYVDEDGVEHEVGEDQLDEFEVVDEGESR